MDTPVEEIAKNSDGLFARINHPIFGAFIASWLLCNWEIPYLLICGVKTPETTILEIKTNYLNWCHIWALLFLPFILTVAFLSSAPYLHDKYIWFKKWVTEKVMETEPIPKSQYIKMESEKKQIQQERFAIQGAYNLVRNKIIKLPINPNSSIPRPSEIQADQLINNYFSSEERSQSLQNVNTQLKADLLEAQKRIEELEKDKK